MNMWEKVSVIYNYRCRFCSSGVSKDRQIVQFDIGILRYDHLSESGDIQCDQILVDYWKKGVKL